MAVCEFCGKETEGASSCIESRIRIGGKDFAPLPYEGRRETVFTRGDAPRRCAECNVLPGGFHHVGCVMEICPQCGGKWVYCKCDGLKVRMESGGANKGRVIPFKKKTGRSIYRFSK